jgi:hypothetical protein
VEVGTTVDVSEIHVPFIFMAEMGRASEYSQASKYF